MTRERAGTAGVTWQQEPTRMEVVVVDVVGDAWSVTPWLAPAPGRPFVPLVPVNREQRRAAKRAQRKGGKR